jgi:hypothetical protein
MIARHRKTNIYHGDTEKKGEDRVIGKAKAYR